MELEILPKEKPAPTKKITTLEDLFVMFIKLKGQIAPLSLQSYQVSGRMFCSFMNGRRLNPQTMVDWSLFMRQGRKPGTITKIHTCVCGFLRFLHKMGYTREDLGQLIPRPPPIPSRVPQIITEDEYERLKAWCHGKLSWQVHLWLIILGYRTGMSLVDCCHLRWCHVTLNENGPSYIDVHRIKTARLGMKALCQIPIVPMTDVHDWMLHLKKQEHLNYKRFDGITDFVHQDAPGLYACTFARVAQDFVKIFKGAKVGEGKTFRNLRNAFCSNAVNSGMQTGLVCKMTGHSSTSMLLKYLRPDRQALQDGLQKSFQYSMMQSGIVKQSSPLTEAADYDGTTAANPDTADTETEGKATENHSAEQGTATH
jgi:site-specific recombinase XerD